MPAFDYKPTLVGERLALRPLMEVDFDALYDVANDPLLWAGHPSKNRYELDIFTEYFAEALKADTAFVAIEKNSNEIVGTSRFYGLDTEKSEIEIGWSFLARRCWGGAYNGEMKHLMLSHAFQYVDQVTLIIDINNVRSQKAAEKIGAVLSNPHFERNDAINVVYTIDKVSYNG